MNIDHLNIRLVVALVVGIFFCQEALVHPSAYPCGREGIWIQTLGSGDLDIKDDRAAESYLVWIDNNAVLLVGAGEGSGTRFSETGADLTTLDAILLPRTSVAHVAALPSLIGSSRRAYRERKLTILGPTGNDTVLSTSDLINRMFDPDGPYPELASISDITNPFGFTLRTQDVLAVGTETWKEFGTNQYLVSALPVRHRDAPTLAWRIDFKYETTAPTTTEEEGENERDWSMSTEPPKSTVYSDYANVFASGFSGVSHAFIKFAMDADVIVFSHALPEGATSRARENFLEPKEIGEIAATADVRFIILGGRGWRTFGRELRTKEVVEKSYDGTIILPDDLDCWGL